MVAPKMAHATEAHKKIKVIAAMRLIISLFPLFVGLIFVWSELGTHVASHINSL
jgi:hypothetical protein